MKTKLELIIAAGGDELPDILIGSFGQELIMPWARAGMIVPVTKYYDTHAYFMRESLANSVDFDLDKIKKYITSYNGEIYGVFSWNESMNNQHAISRINIYIPWLEALKLEIPKTTDDFYNLLRAFKERDPNANGKADEIPLTTCVEYIPTMIRILMTPFVYTQPNYWIVNDGKIDVAFRQDGWREGLRYVNKLYKEGLLDPASFTQDQAAMTITLSQDPMIVGAFARMSSTNMSKDDPDRYKFWRIEQLQGPDGKIRTSYQPAIPVITGIITKNCKHVEEAFMLMDFMTGVEMSIITRYGFEGENWTYTDDTLVQKYIDFWKEFEKEPGYNLPEFNYGKLPVARPGERVFDASNWGTLQNTWWGQVGPNIMTQKIEDMYMSSNLDTEIEKLNYLNEYRRIAALNEAIKYRDDSLIVAGLIYNEEEQEIIRDYYSEILTYVDECWAAFVTGRMDINDDSVWKEYLSTLEKMNLEKCIEVTQSCYTRMNRK